LDACLAELLCARVIDLPKEAEAFFGLNGDGRAAGATFGARIQLAALLGIIQPEDAEVLKAVKNIRNAFAHRVKVDFTSPELRKYMRALFELYSSLRLVKGRDAPVGRLHELGELESHLDQTPEAGAVLFLAVFCLYKERFHSLSALNKRVNPIEEE